MQIFVGKINSSLGTCLNKVQINKLSKEHYETNKTKDIKYNSNYSKEEPLGNFTK